MKSSRGEKRRGEEKRSAKKRSKLQERGEEKNGEDRSVERRRRGEQKSMGNERRCLRAHFPWVPREKGTERERERKRERERECWRAEGLWGINKTRSVPVTCDTASKFLPLHTTQDMKTHV